MHISLQRLRSYKNHRTDGNLLIVGYGAPRITETQLKDALETTISFIEQVSDVKTETTKVFSATPK